jgi:hypothetical protein
VTSPAALLDFFKKGEVPRDVRLLAAKGGLETRAQEQLAIIVHLVNDPDEEIRSAAEATLRRVPSEPLMKVLALPDTPIALREFFAARGVAPAPAAGPAVEVDEPLVNIESVESAEDGDQGDPGDPREEDEGDARETATQAVAKMGFTQRLKAAVKGTREMRAEQPQAERTGSRIDRAHDQRLR